MNFFAHQLFDFFRRSCKIIFERNYVCPASVLLVYPLFYAKCHLVARSKVIFSGSARNRVVILDYGFAGTVDNNDDKLFNR